MQAQHGGWDRRSYPALGQDPAMLDLGYQGMRIGPNEHQKDKRAQW